RDKHGALNGTLEGIAKTEKGALVLDGKTACMVTPPLTRDVTQKTLEVWVRLGNPEQRGGAAIGIETLDGKTFDAIVFGEKEPRRWIAGSNNFLRTQAIKKANDETEAATRTVHLAAVYEANGTIRLYREGQPYGEPYAAGEPVQFEAGKCHLVLGLRHS